jgi:hypothetical protein
MGSVRAHDDPPATEASDAWVATAATWAVFQAVDGVTLKRAVDAWVAASGTEEATRNADAEAARWLEWGLESYFRVLLGVAFLLVGAAAVVSRLVPGSLGVLLVIAGLLSLVIGVSVGYAGFVFIVGLLVVARRARDPGSLAGS